MPVFADLPAPHLRLRFTASSHEPDTAKLKPAELAERTRPRPLAMLTNRLPYLVERQIGQGQRVHLVPGRVITHHVFVVTRRALPVDQHFGQRGRLLVVLASADVDHRSRR